MQEAPRKRPALDQRRTVVHTSKAERAAHALLQQLNTIRNDKAAKRREASARKRAERDKWTAIETAWRDKYAALFCPACV